MQDNPMKIAVCKINDAQWVDPCDGVDYFVESSSNHVYRSLWKLAIEKRHREIVHDFQYDVVASIVGKGLMSEIKLPQVSPGHVYLRTVDVDVMWPFVITANPHFMISTSCTFDTLARFYHANFITHKSISFGAQNIADDLNRKFYVFCAMSGIKICRLENNE